MARILARSSSWESGPSTLASVSGHPCHAPRYSQTSGRSASYCSSAPATAAWHIRSEEHTSELQSRLHLVCRLLLEKKKKSPKTDLQSNVEMTGVLLFCAIFTTT